MAELLLFRSSRVSNQKFRGSYKYEVIAKAFIPDHLADHPAIASFRWAYYRGSNKYTGYARRWEHIERRTISIYLHRMIYELLHGPIPEGQTIDHIDGNGLNNTAENLRLANRSQQQFNQRTRRPNTNGFKGVFFKKPERDGYVRPHPWQAKIVPPGHKQIYLGYFKSAPEAGYAYNVAAAVLHGEFFCPNDIPQGVLTPEQMASIEAAVITKLGTLVTT